MSNAPPGEPSVVRWGLRTARAGMWGIGLVLLGGVAVVIRALTHPTLDNAMLVAGAGFATAGATVVMCVGAAMVLFGRLGAKRKR